MRLCYFLRFFQVCSGDDVDDIAVIHFVITCLFSEELAQVYDFSNQPLLHTTMMIDDDGHHDYHHHHEDVGDIEMVNNATPGLRFSGVFTQHDAESSEMNTNHDDNDVDDTEDDNDDNGDDYDDVLIDTFCCPQDFTR